MEAFLVALLRTSPDFAPIVVEVFAASQIHFRHSTRKFSPRTQRRKLAVRARSYPKNLREDAMRTHPARRYGQFQMLGPEPSALSSSAEGAKR